MNKMTVGEAFSKAVGKDIRKATSVIRKLAAIDKEEREIFVVLAALTDKDRNILIDYWDDLLGPEFARDQVKDYLPRGTKKYDGKNATAALKPKDRNAVREFWNEFYGGEYSSDMVEDYKSPASKQDVTASDYSKYVKHAGLSPKTAAALRKLDKDVALEILEVLASAEKE